MISKPKTLMTDDWHGPKREPHPEQTVDDKFIDDLLKLSDDKVSSFIERGEEEHLDRLIAASVEIAKSQRDDDERTVEPEAGLSLQEDANWLHEGSKDAEVGEYLVSLLIWHVR